MREVMGKHPDAKNAELAEYFVEAMKKKGQGGPRFGEDRAGVRDGEIGGDETERWREGETEGREAA